LHTIRKFAAHQPLEKRAVRDRRVAVRIMEGATLLRHLRRDRDRVPLHAELDDGA
jgi:hypothetical protein